jgi:hypothetical protein
MKRILAIAILLSLPLLADVPGGNRVQGYPNGLPVPVLPGAAADVAGTSVSLTTACATGVSCGANTTALVALAGQSAANVTFASGSSPLMTVVADCSQDNNTLYGLSASPGTSGLVTFISPSGVASTSVVNPGNTSYALIPPPGCTGATHVRVRVGALTSGSVSAQLRAVYGNSTVQDVVSNTQAANTLSTTCADPGTSCAAGSFIAIPTAGQKSFGFHVPTSATLAGTLKAECSFDAGATYNLNIAYFDVPGVTPQSTAVMSSGLQYDATIMGCGGADRLRVRNVNATGSGAVNMIGTMLDDPSTLTSGTPNSTIQPPRLQANGSWNGTNLVAYAMGDGVSDTSTQRVTLAQRLTYGASTNAKTATAAGTGVFWNLCGSATKTIRVQSIRVSGTVATTAVYGDIILRKTSAATTAGTATTLTNVPLDSTQAAATAVSKYYTALGTAGTLVGAIDGQSLFMPVTATPATTPQPAVFGWRDTDSASPVLRGTAQCLEMAFGTTTTNAPTLTVSSKWTEE